MLRIYIERKTEHQYIYMSKKVSREQELPSPTESSFLWNLFLFFSEGAQAEDSDSHCSG